MPRSETPAGTEEPQKTDALSGKAWTAIAATSLFVCIVAWVGVSVLTATPSVDPTVHADAVALANSQQADPDSPSRYAELVEALRVMDRAMDQVANEVVREEGYQGSGLKMLDFNTARFPPIPSDLEPEKHLADAEDARRAVDVILQRKLLDDVAGILRSPNLANEYPIGVDDGGDSLPMFEWPLEELSLFRKQSLTFVGCAHVLAERGDTERAAELLEGIAPLPGVLTRNISLVEHLIGYAVGTMIAQEIEFTARHPDLTPEALASLQRAQRKLSDLGSLEIAIRGEAIFMRDFLYRTHTEGGRYIPSAGEEMMDGMGGSGDDELLMKLKDASGYLAVRRDTSLKKAEELYGLLRDAVNETDPTRRANIIADFDAQVDSIGPRYTLLQIAMPAVSRVVTNSFEIRSQMLALEVLLAMAEYRLDSGEWPKSLNTLVPDYLDAIPTDPQTGERFEYEYEEGVPPSLESLGIDSELKP